MSRTGNATTIFQPTNQTVSIALAVQEAVEKVQKDLLFRAHKSPESPTVGVEFTDVHASKKVFSTKSALIVGIL